MRSKKKFVVIVNCQGQPFYYFYKTLLGSLFGYARLYLKNKKYKTMTFSLKESVCLKRDIEDYEIERY